MDPGVPSKSIVNLRMTVIFSENMIRLSLWLVIYGCSNVAKLFEKKYVFKKKICMIFTKILFFSVNFFFQIKLCIQNKYLYPLSKNLILLKNFHSKRWILFSV